MSQRLRGASRVETVLGALPRVISLEHVCRRGCGNSESTDALTTACVATLALLLAAVSPDVSS